MLLKAGESGERAHIVNSAQHTQPTSELKSRNSSQKKELLYTHCSEKLLHCPRS